jgi:hypothetical protein
MRMEVHKINDNAVTTIIIHQPSSIATLIFAFHKPPVMAKRML